MYLTLRIPTVQAAGKDNILSFASKKDSKKVIKSYRRKGNKKRTETLEIPRISALHNSCGERDLNPHRIAPTRT